MSLAIRWTGIVTAKHVTNCEGKEVERDKAVSERRDADHFTALWSNEALNRNGIKLEATDNNVSP